MKLFSTFDIKFKVYIYKVNIFFIFQFHALALVFTRITLAKKMNRIFAHIKTNVTKTTFADSEAVDDWETILERN